jgi:hypothetical protein
MRRSATACLVILWVRIQPGAWMSVCFEYCVLSVRGLCDELIFHPKESYRLWCVGWDLETSWMRKPSPNGGLSRQKKSWFHWQRVLRLGSAAARLVGLWIRIPPGAWVCVVSVVCCQGELYASGWSLVQRSPTDFCLWVWSRKLKNEEALGHWGVLRHCKNKVFFCC